MTTTMDIAVCLDCSSSISFYLNIIRSKIRSILNKAFLSCHEGDIRMALIEFQSHFDNWTTNTHPFTSSIDTFQQCMDAVETNGGMSDESKAIVDALDASLNLSWRPNTNPNRYHEKLVILITDGPPCNLLNDECPCYSKDLWKLANEFEKQDITLVVIGIEPSVVVCDDFYCALANKTGGEYLPLINASRVLSSVIQRAILEEYTLSQLFRRLNVQLDIEINSLYHYKYVEKRARFMNEYCHNMYDIRKWLYTYRNQLNAFINDRIDVYEQHEFEYSIPSSYSDNLDYIPSSFMNIPMNLITSTPVTEDEGYRTRLPTTASADSSFMCINGSSPILYHHPTNVFWENDSDDECF